MAQSTSALPAGPAVPAAGSFPAAESAFPPPAAEPDYLAGPPLFWRLLAANLVVVLGGAVVGTALTRQFVLSGHFTPLTHAGMVAAAIALSAAITALILRIAFQPLRTLRHEIDEYRRGGRPARAASAVGRLGDPDIVAVAQAVRGLWDQLDRHVQLLEESNRRLEEQRQELAEKTVQLQRHASLVLTAQEEERRRIARELHDETMQSLAALIMGLERGMQAMPVDVPHLRSPHQTVARLRDLAETTLEELKLLALDLRPSVLDDHGLTAAVRWLAETERARYGVSTSVILGEGIEDSEEEAARLPATVETALFRIVQEALANVGKHAQATHAEVRLSRTAESATVEVRDNGVGLPERPGTPPEHMGVYNMRERAALLGGRCRVTSLPSGGVSVQVTLPIAASEPHRHAEPAATKRT